jgi:hypothetical protein
MNNGVDILQTGSGKASTMTYDNVSVYGMYQKEPFRKGLHLKGLGREATVVMPHVQGNIRIIDSAQATILLNNTYEGSLVVEGKDKQRTGFLGVLSRLGTTCTHALYVKNNHSLVAGDFYVEQADNGFLFEGTEQDPPGRITIQGAKLHLKPTAKGNVPYEIRDYHGQILIGHQQYYVEPVNMQIIHTGRQPLDLVLFANSFYNTALTTRKESGLRLQLIGNSFVRGNKGGPENDESTADTLKHVALALDDLRTLGEMDLRLNHWQ